MEPFNNLDSFGLVFSSYLGNRTFCSRRLSLWRQPACAGIWGEPRIWQPLLLPEHLYLSRKRRLCRICKCVFVNHSDCFCKDEKKKKARVSFCSLQGSSSTSEGKFLYCWRENSLPLKRPQISFEKRWIETNSTIVPLLPSKGSVVMVRVVRIIRGFHGAKARWEEDRLRFLLQTSRGKLTDCLKY